MIVVIPFLAETLAGTCNSAACLHQSSMALLVPVAPFTPAIIATSSVDFLTDSLHTSAPAPSTWALPFSLHCNPYGVPSSSWSDQPSRRDASPTPVRRDASPPSLCSHSHANSSCTAAPFSNLGDTRKPMDNGPRRPIVCAARTPSSCSNGLMPCLFQSSCCYNGATLSAALQESRVLASPLADRPLPTCALALRLSSIPLSAQLWPRDLPSLTVLGATTCAPSVLTFNTYAAQSTARSHISLAPPLRQPFAHTAPSIPGLHAKPFHTDINDGPMIHLVVQCPSMQASGSHPQPLISVCGHQQGHLLQFFVLHSNSRMRAHKNGKLLSTTYLHCAKQSREAEVAQHAIISLVL
ncbi:hypothetical protein KP509_1Z143500 [Ceratopteris richardii]|nr:hypothetical protein KP509_1Z143500 [Ceratopteris richardii]